MYRVQEEYQILLNYLHPKQLHSFCIKLDVGFAQPNKLMAQQKKNIRKKCIEFSLIFYILFKLYTDLVRKLISFNFEITQ